MATLNISLPDAMRQYIETRVSMGEYQSASDYLRDLIRHDKAYIETLLLEGEESGDDGVLDMAAIRAKAYARLNSA